MRLIIVGNSATSIGILSHLLTLPDLEFNNIVLLSSKFVNQNWFLNITSSEICNQPHFMETLLLEKKVKMVQGQMTSLNRKKKSIIVEGLDKKEFSMHYDYLVITTGLVDKTDDYLNQKGTLTNIFRFSSDRDNSSQNLGNVSTNSNANLPGNLVLNSASIIPNTDKNNQFVSKSNLNNLTDSSHNNSSNNNGGTQNIFQQKEKKSVGGSGKNNGEESHQLISNSMGINISKNFFVSVDNMQTDILEILSKENKLIDSNYSKKTLLASMAKHKSWIGKILHKKIPKNATLYGESPKIFCLLESLLSDFDMDASKVTIVLPSEDQHTEENILTEQPTFKTRMSNYADLGFTDNEKLLERLDSEIDYPKAFENIELKEFYLGVLEFFGINVIRNAEIIGLCELENSIIIRRDLGDEEDKHTSKSKVAETSLISNHLSEVDKLCPRVMDLKNKEESNDKPDNKFLEYLKTLKDFKYFLDFQNLSKTVIKHLNVNNPGLEGMLDDYNISQKLSNVSKNQTSTKELADKSEFLQTEDPNEEMENFLGKLLQKKPHGMTRNIIGEGDDLIQDTMVFMGKTFDVGTSVFKAIQDNGLVFNGRLIVTNNFRTIDRFIYACGKISEFSQRYKNHALGRSLRVDKFDGFEVGNHFSRQFVSYLRGDPFEEGNHHIYNQKILINYTNNILIK